MNKNTMRKVASLLARVISGDRAGHTRCLFAVGIFAVAISAGVFWNWRDARGGLCGDRAGSSGDSGIFRAICVARIGNARAGDASETSCGARILSICEEPDVCRGAFADCGVSAAIGECRVARYGAAVAVGFHLFVMGYEEPTLRKTFSGEYADFCANVPRWIPRLRPWDGGAATAAE